MADYVVTVEATSNTSANTQDEFIEITGAASTGFFLKRIRVSCATPGIDAVITATVVKLSSNGASGTTGTINKVRPTAPAATSAAKVKNGTAAFTLGSVSATLDQIDVNTRAIWEWVPAEERDFYDSGSAGILALLIKCSMASVVIDATFEFEE